MDHILLGSDFTDGLPGCNNILLQLLPILCVGGGVGGGGGGGRSIPSVSSLNKPF